MTSRASPLPYQTPPFAQIMESDFLPVPEAGIEARYQEVAANTSHPEPATFAKTFEVLECSGQLLNQVFAAMTSANNQRPFAEDRRRRRARLA